VRVGDDEWESLGEFPSTADTDANPELLSNAVTALLVDEAGGVVWAATENGLGRYDGSEWVRFSTDEGLPDNYITALALVEDVVFAGTNSGLAAFNGEQFEPLPEVDFSPVWGLVAASDGSMWASGGGGVARRNPDGTADYWPYTELTTYGNYRGVEAPDGRLFFGTDHGVLTFSGDDFTQWTAPNVPVHPAFDAVRSDPTTGWLWFKEEYGVEVDIYDSANDAWFPAPEVDCSCTPRAWDEDGRLGAASELGLWIVEDAEVVENFTTENGLPHDDVRAVAPVPGGSAWIATLGGLAYYENGEITQVFNADNSELVSDEVVSLLTASDGSLWAGTTSGLSRRLPDGAWETYSIDNPFRAAVRINDLAEAPNGEVWVATDGDGLARFRPADAAWDRFSPEMAGVNLPTAEVNSVAVSPDGTVWVGLDFAGAARYDGTAWLPFGVEEGLIHSNVYDILVDDSGTVWFATSGGATRYVP
jgi:ligand-binding sensor domain-containing protein